MELYGGIDLHSNNSVVVVSDEKDKVVYRRRHPNDLEEIVGPTGYIYPREQRALRDLLRKRISLVQLRTSTKLSLQNLSQRNLGRRFSGPDLRSLTTEGIEDRLDDPNLVLAMDSTLQVTECLDQEIQRLEREILRQTRPHPAFGPLRSVSGVGRVLAQTILLETGEIGRFPAAGTKGSDRCVQRRCY